MEVSIITLMLVFSGNYQTLAKKTKAAEKPPTCTGAGSFPATNCNEFYKCKENSFLLWHNWVAVLETCPKNQIFNSTMNACSPGSCNNGTTTTDSGSVTTSTVTNTGTEIFILTRSTTTTSLPPSQKHSSTVYILSTTISNNPDATTGHKTTEKNIITQVTANSSTSSTAADTTLDHDTTNIPTPSKSPNTDGATTAAVDKYLFVCSLCFVLILLKFKD